MCLNGEERASCGLDELSGHHKLPFYAVEKRKEEFFSAHHTPLSIEQDVNALGAAGC